MATQPQERARNRPERRQRGTDWRSRIGGRQTRRFVAGILGAVVILRGLRRRDVRGIVMALAGGWLVSRALGRKPGTRVRGAASEIGSRLGDRAGAAEPTQVSRSITIDESPEDLYETWRDPDQLTQIVGHFADVRATDEDVLHWTVQAPGGREVSWDTRFVEAEPGEVLRWETPTDAMVATEGELRFGPAPADQGTEVTLTIDFDPPGGAVGAAAIQRLDLVPKAVVGKSLRRFKSLVETGEIPTLSGNPSARGSGDLV